MKEWIVSYSKYIDGNLCEYEVAFTKWLKVLRWFLRNGSGCCDIYIWTSVRH